MRFYILLHMTGTVNNGDVLFSAALGHHELSLVESLGRCKRTLGCPSGMHTVLVPFLESLCLNLIHNHQDSRLRTKGAFTRHF